MNCLTHHYDNARTGWNPNETILAPTVLGKFGLLFRQTLDDIVFAQPLYVEGLSINGVIRNVVFVGTEAGTVYAWDADTQNAGLWLWKQSLVNTAVGESRPAKGFGVITATPVVDQPTNRMYVIGYFQDHQANYFFRVHALDITTGHTIVTSASLAALNPPLEAPGIGAPQDPNTPGMVYFDPAQQFNRAALLLAHGNVYAGFGSHGDQAPYHGWVLGFDAKTLNLIGLPFCSTPDASSTPYPDPLDDPELGGSFWQAGFGLAADGDGHIYGMTGNGLFIDPPNAATCGALTSYAWPETNAQHLFFLGTDQHVHELWWDGTGWHPNDITKVTGGPPPSGGTPLTSYEWNQTNTQHVFYLGQDQHVHELRWDSAGWRHNDVTNVAGAPSAAACSPLTSYVWPQTSTQHAFYLGTDQHVHELWGDGAVWHHNDITNAASTTFFGIILISAPLAVGGSPLTSYAWPDTNTQHVFYLGADRHVHEFWWDGKWHAKDVTVAAGAPEAAVSSPLTSYEWNQTNTQHVFYLGADQHVHELWWDGPGWHHKDLTNAVGVLPAVGGSPLTSYAWPETNTQHVFYLSADQHVHELWWDGTWHPNDVTNAAGAPNAAACTLLTSYEWNLTSTQHVFHLGIDQHILELWWDGNGWHPNDITDIHKHLNLADSLVKLDQNLNIVGSFTPTNYEDLALEDLDFGSGGPVVIPDNADGGRLEVIGCGKDAMVYLVDRATLIPQNLRQTGLSLSQLRLVTSGSAEPALSGGGPGVWGGPAFYGGALGNVVYYCGDHGPLQAITINNGKLAPHMIGSPPVPNQTPPGSPTEVFPGEGGVIPVVSSNGSMPGTGIVWVVTRVDPDNPNLHLRAYAAEDLTKPNLFDAAVGTWPVNGPGAFLVPVVVNGKVYVASDQLYVYGIT